MKNTAGRFSMGQEGNKLVAGLIAALIALTVLLVVVLFIINKDSQNDQEYIAHASELRVLSQEIAKNATEAAGGTASAFDQLRRSRDEFQQLWSYVVDGNPETGLPPSEIARQSSVQTNWDVVRDNADSILSTRDAVLGLHEVARTLNETIPQLQVEYDDIVQSLFGRVLQGQVEGNPAMGISRVDDEDAIYGLEAVGELFEFVSQNVDAILEASPDLFKVRTAASDIFQNSQILLDDISVLANQFTGQAGSRLISPTLAFILLAAMVGIVVLIGVVLYREAQERLATTQEQNEQNQNAILRLLDELADLADGDLTTEATVTEDFTGAIADSINYAIDQMRGLVQAIRGTAVRVASAAQETQATAMHLADASEHQAQEIAGASAAVNEMAVSIDQVSSNAAESSAVAERSVAIAKKGAEVVQNTIRGMDNIREQIQETSKRIKRLGESSQEIGDIVSLINDIADQTNILSLNAAIQASMAGDAGRGFAVVADEVQRLAERSSAATKQIEALVKTIQSDTNEAVISMEHTTAEVVRGARLAQDAGIALEEIENVSMSLAELIQNISNAARQQSSSAAHISNTMNVIQEITSQTSSGTNATAKSIGNLAEMASELRSSVAGFTLPEEEGSEQYEEEDSDVPVVG
jgi:twitching motility protein PilJ